MHPNNLKVEAQQPASILADQVYEIVYKELIYELREELKDFADVDVPVYPFG